MKDAKAKIVYTTTTSTEIELCRTCNGTGVTSTEKLVCYHNNDYETVYQICETCGGDGRYIVEKVSRDAKIYFDDSFSGVTRKIERIPVDADILSLSKSVTMKDVRVVELKPVNES